MLKNWRTMSKCQMYCFRADYQGSTHFDERTVPDWLRLEADWQGYKLLTLPEVADVARVLGALSIEDSADEWISHLESLGLKGVQQVTCEEWFEDRRYC